MQQPQTLHDWFPIQFSNWNFGVRRSRQTDGLAQSAQHQDRP